MLVGDTMIGDTVCLGQIREMPEEEEEHWRTIILYIQNMLCIK
jgi:hypothetical protein